MAAGAHAKRVIAGLELELDARAMAKPAALDALDRAQPALAGDEARGLDLGVRVNLFCRDHLLGVLPDEVTVDDIEAVRAAIAVQRRTGAWSVELVEYLAR